jgi:hypothetical protein
MKVVSETRKLYFAKQLLRYQLIIKYIVFNIIKVISQIAKEQAQEKQLTNRTEFPQSAIVSSAQYKQTPTDAIFLPLI